MHRRTLGNSEAVVTKTDHFHRRLDMRLIVRAALLAMFTGGFFTWLGGVEAQSAKPLSEEALVQRLKAGLEDDELIPQLEKKGISFNLDDAALERLKKAGASPALLTAVRKATVVKES